MKVFDVDGCNVREFLPVDMVPYPHITLGEGGHKRATWVALGRRDAPALVLPAGEVAGEELPTRIVEAGVMRLEGERYLIVAPRPGNDNRALILWRVSSGYRGSATISAGDDVLVVATDTAWHSGRGNLGETAECLAVLKPSQCLNAEISGRQVQEDRARLTWDGERILVEYYCSDASPFVEGEGDYV